jgi:hypothetical protein
MKGIPVVSLLVYRGGSILAAGMADFAYLDREVAGDVRTHESLFMP